MFLLLSKRGLVHGVLSLSGPHQRTSTLSSEGDNLDRSRVYCGRDVQCALQHQTTVGSTQCFKLLRDGQYCTLRLNRQQSDGGAIPFWARSDLAVWFRLLSRLRRPRLRVDLGPAGC